MGEIERVSRSLVGGTSIGKSRSTSDISWDSGAEWIWHEISELPVYLIKEFHEKFLFPESLFMSIVKCPTVQNLNGVPTYIEINGWLAGSDCFSEFVLRRNISQTDNDFIVIAKRHDFKDSVPKLAKSVSADSKEGQKKQQIEQSKQSGKHPLENGQYLPQSLQKMLATVPNRKFISSYISQHDQEDSAGVLSQRVNVTVYNEVLSISIEATRMASSGSNGSTPLSEKLELADWNVVVVRGFFK